VVFIAQSDLLHKTIQKKLGKVAFPPFDHKMSLVCTVLKSFE